MSLFNFEVVGDHKNMERVVLPFHSMNVAFSGNGDKEYGFPTRTMVEISGLEGRGKSTFATALASYVSQAYGDLPISYLDLEGQSEATIYNTLQNSGYASKSFNWVTPDSIKEDETTDEKLLKKLLQALYNEPPSVGILDSVAAVAGMAEVEGDIGDANMGRRAFPMAQFTRGVIRALRMIEIPSCMFLLNHVYDKLGAIGPAKQTTSPGGSVKKFLEAVKINVKIPYVSYISGGETKKEGKWDESGAWILEGTVEKNRPGIADTTFQVFVYGGWGVHVGMSALVDCLAAGLAKVKSGKVIMDGEDYGLLSKIIDTRRDDKKFFQPFHNALKVEVIKEESEE